MGITDKMWDAVTTVIRMNDNVERMAGVSKDPQCRIENQTERVIRLETSLEVVLASKALRTPAGKRPQIEGN